MAIALLVGRSSLGRLFTQRFGGTYGRYVEMHEFDNMADFEKHRDRALKNEEHMEIFEGQMLLFVPDTVSVRIWSPVDLTQFESEQQSNPT